MKMSKKEAIAYLLRKGKIELKLSKKDEGKIKEVMKEGKIYGDPVAAVQW